MSHGGTPMGTPSKDEEIEIVRAQTLHVACIHVINAAYRSSGGVVQPWDAWGLPGRRAMTARAMILGHSEEPVRTAVKTEIARAHNLGQ